VFRVGERPVSDALDRATLARGWWQSLAGLLVGGALGGAGLLAVQRSWGGLLFGLGSSFVLVMLVRIVVLSSQLRFARRASRPDGDGSACR
jgi:hypothetical protein